MRNSIFFLQIALDEYGERNNRRSKDTEKAMRELADKVRNSYLPEMKTISIYFINVITYSE